MLTEKKVQRKHKARYQVLLNSSVTYASKISSVVIKRMEEKGNPSVILADYTSNMPNLEIRYY